MNKFTFEYSKKITEKEYVSLNTVKDNWSTKSIIKKIIVLIVSALCFFSKYTIGIGILFLLLFVFISLMPIWSISLKKKNYKEIKYLNQKITFGLNEEEFWIKCNIIEAKGKWKSLSVWEEKDDILRLSVDGIPPMYFPVKSLKKENIYDDVITLCKKHGKEFGRV